MTKIMEYLRNSIKANKIGVKSYAGVGGGTEGEKRFEEPPSLGKKKTLKRKKNERKKY